jgi:hypothetical protein
MTVPTTNAAISPPSTPRTANAATSVPAEKLGPTPETVRKWVRLDHPKKVTGNTRSSDPEAAHRLWQVSGELTGVSYAWP